MLRIIIVGKSGVGKTSIFNQLTSTKQDTPDDRSLMEQQISPTIGINVKIIKHYNTSQHYINIMLMDTCGLSSFQSINLQYLHGTRAYIVVFDTTNRASFIDAQRWISHIMEHDFEKNKTYSQDDSVILLIGNTFQTEQSILQTEIDSFVDLYNISYIQYNPAASESTAWFRQFVNNAFNQDTVNSCMLPIDSPPRMRFC